MISVTAWRRVVDHAKTRRTIELSSKAEEIGRTECFEFHRAHSVVMSLSRVDRSGQKIRNHFKNWWLRQTFPIYPLEFNWTCQSPVHFAWLHSQCSSRLVFIWWYNGDWCPGFITDSVCTGTTKSQFTDDRLQIAFPSSTAPLVLVHPVGRCQTSP